MIDTIPSVRWDVLQAPALAKPADRYQGHLPDGSSVQKHSTDALYREHGIHLRCIEGANGRRLWQAVDTAGRVVAAHPKHSGAYFIAMALHTGA